MSPWAPALLSMLSPWLALAVGPAGDRLEVRDGTARVATFTPRTPRARRGAATVRETEVAGHRVLEVRVPIAGSQRHEVWVAERRPSGVAPIWAGLVGPLDEDGETGREVALEPDGVELYRTAARISRCDGVAGRLAPRRWDFARGRFEAAEPPLPPPAASSVQARPGNTVMPRGRGGGGFYWTATSSAAGAGEGRAPGAPVALNDGDPRTTWHAEGGGRGQFVTAYTGAEGVIVRGIRLRLPATGRAPRRLALLLGAGDDRRIDVELPGKTGGEALWAPLPHPLVASCVTVLIREAAPGAGPVGIADLDVVTDVDGAQGMARLVQATRDGGGCEGRVPLLLEAGALAVGPVARAISAGPAPGRECLLDALGRLTESDPAIARDAAVAVALVAGLDRATDAEEKLILAALPRLPEPPVPALARVLGDERQPDEQRARAARALAALFGPHPQRPARAADGARTALLAAVGQGSATLRGEVRERLARSPPPLAGATLRALAATPPTAAARRADLMLIAGAAAGREPGERAAVLAVVRAAARAGEDFPVRARAIEALGRMGGGEALEELAGLRAGSPDPVLRFLAARELAALTEPDAQAALRAALSDGDPRVRETAALGMTARQDGQAAAALIEVARRERWPFARRAEVTAVAAVCGPETNDFLVHTEERDLPEVRRTALEGLTRCRDPRAGPLLLARLGGRAEDPELRAVAARLLGALADRTLAPRLAEILARLRVESQEDLALEGVAITTLQALARVGGPEAVRGARTLLDDERPALRRAALEALGTLCDGAAGASALEAATRDRDPTVAAAAAAARRRCPR